MLVAGIRRPVSARCDDLNDDESGGVERFESAEIVHLTTRAARATQFNGHLACRDELDGLRCVGLRTRNRDAGTVGGSNRQRRSRRHVERVRRPVERRLTAC